MISGRSLTFESFSGTIMTFKQLASTSMLGRLSGSLSKQGPIAEPIRSSTVTLVDLSGHCGVLPPMTAFFTSRSESSVNGSA